MLKSSPMLYDSSSVDAQWGVLVVDAQTSEVLRVSDSCAEILGISTEAALGAHLADVLDGAAASAITDAMSTVSEHGRYVFLDLPLGNPARTSLLAVHRSYGTVVRRDVLIVEVHGCRDDGPGLAEPALGAALVELATAESVDGLINTLTRVTQQITGYDRASALAFREESTFRIFAESTAPGVSPILGANFRSSDARPRRSDPEITADHLYVPSHTAPQAHLRPADDPAVDVDLRWAFSRSPTTAGLAYLATTGAQAYFSAWICSSDGTAWGMLACHHYRGPREIPFRTRRALVRFCDVAAERIAALRLRDRERTAKQSIELMARSFKEMSSVGCDDIGLALTDSRSVLEYLRADGLVVAFRDRVRTAGSVPTADGIDALCAWVEDQAEELTAAHAPLREHPDSSRLVEEYPGVLAARLPDGQSIIWLRRSTETPEEWMEVPGSESSGLGTSGLDTTGLDAGPEDLLGAYRTERTTLTDTALPWSDQDVQTAEYIRQSVVESLYVQERNASRETLALQRSLLPEDLPQPDGWALEGRCTPAGRGVVGGDWFDAFELDDSRIALTVGDVTGHGLPAAAAMGRLRLTLRTCLLTEPDLGAAARLFHRVAARSMPEYIATVIVIVVDPDSGQMETVRWGHLPGVLVDTSGTTRWLDGPKSMPLGLASQPPAVTVGRMSETETVVLFSDGLVERRGEGLWVGLRRLENFLGEVPVSSAADIVAAVRDDRSRDDATILLMRPTGVRSWPTSHDQSHDGPDRGRHKGLSASTERARRPAAATSSGSPG